MSVSENQNAPFYSRSASKNCKSALLAFQESTCQSLLAPDSRKALLALLSHLYVPHQILREAQSKEYAFDPLFL